MASFEQFCKRNFGEIYSKRLTTSAYVDWVSEYVT